MDLSTTFKLNNGVAMPAVGLGTYLAPGPEAGAAVKHALRIGYRHIDTARLYRNEREIGAALCAGDVPREAVFVVTKLWNSDHGYDATLAAFDASLARLGLDNIDLYLIHFPVEKLRGESWRALERIYADGRARAIGVSNYTVRHLRELLDDCEVVPAVNQVEFSPYLYQRELLEYCRAHGIQLESYSTLTRGEKLADPPLVAVAARHGKTPAQVLLRWTLQHRVIVIPKSVRPARIVENADLFDFELSPDEMAKLDALDEGLRVSWDPSDAP